MTYIKPLKLCVLLAGLSGACTGQIGDAALAAPLGAGGNGTGGTPNNVGGTGGGAGAEGTIDSGGAAGGVPGKVCGTYPNAKPGPGPAPMRRLTRVEYDNTVLDLLGDSSKQSSSFEADARSRLGFDNYAVSQIVTGQLAEDYLDAAEILAATAVNNPKIVPACAVGTEETCARTFITTFGRRAFRRPVTPGDEAILMGLYTAIRGMRDSHALAMKQVLTSILQSPYFLYRAEFGDASGKGLTSWEMASRLSYLVWGSMPDADLFTAAENNALATADQVKAQVTRMMASPNLPRAKAMVARFHAQWLNLQKIDGISRDAKLFPNFAAVKPNMIEETTLFMERAFWQGTAPGMFSAATSFMTPELDKFINNRTTSTLKPGFQVAPLNPEQRVGLLTQAGLLAAYSKPNETLPVVRGRLVAEQVLCAEILDPPADAASMAPMVAPGSSTREKFEAIDNSVSNCGGCHKQLDPVGFTFENYDPAGRWRAMDGGKPVNAAGSIKGAFVGTATDPEVVGAVALSKVIGDSPEMKKCVAKQWLRFALGRAEVAADEKSMEQLFCSFEQSGFNLRDLIVGVAQTESFLGRMGEAP